MVRLRWMAVMRSFLAASLAAWADAGDDMVKEDCKRRNQQRMSFRLDG
jgi:hypothetical protein